MVDVEVVGRLATGGLAPGADGAQGWSISMSSVGWAITALTTNNTVAADVPVGLRNGGFEKSELTTLSRAGSECEGRNGAVSAIVLSFTLPITLDPGGSPHDIIRVTLSGMAPQTEDTCVPCIVSFVDGCRGSGQPVDNKVTYNGETILPSKGSFTTQVCSEPPSCVPMPLNIVMQEEPIQPAPHQTSALFAGKIGPGTIDDMSVEGNTLAVEVREGDTGTKTVYGAIVSQLTAGGAGGVQGWSLSAAVSDSLMLTGASTVGTAGAVTPDGIQNGGFEKTELVDPLRLNAMMVPQGQGAVSAIVCSFTLPITLDLQGTATVLGLTVAAPGPQTADPSATFSGIVSWRDGLRGSGQPVRNVATVNGETEQYCKCQAVTVSFILREAVEFLRCDPNDDGRSDIADAVWIVNELFRGGPASRCVDSADCDDSGIEDLTDAVYCVNYQFRGGSAPPVPFPNCGEDPDGEDDGIGCDDYDSCP
jgi:hypothetical protein